MGSIKTIYVCTKQKSSWISDSSFFCSSLWDASFRQILQVLLTNMSFCIPDNNVDLLAFLQPEKNLRRQVKHWKPLK